MCRNITELRGLQPPATPVEIAAAARQYVRKVSGITHPSAATAEAFEAAVASATKKGQRAGGAAANATIAARSPGAAPAPGATVAADPVATV